MKRWTIAHARDLYALGYSKAEIARRCGVAPSTVANAWHQITDAQGGRCGAAIETARCTLQPGHDGWHQQRGVSWGRAER